MTKTTVADENPYNHPKLFSVDTSAKYGDIFQIDTKDLASSWGHNYYYGAYYVCINRQGLNDVASSSNRPPPLGQTDSKKNWEHAWQTVMNTAFYLVNNANRATNAYIYANGRHCVGLQMFFDPANKTYKVIAPDPGYDATGRFQDYMAAVLNGAGLPMSLVTNADVLLPNGWEYSLTATAYTAEINDGSGSASETNPQPPQADDESGPAAGLGKWHPILYLTSSTLGKITIAARLGLPNGMIQTFGVENVDAVSPIQVLAYPSAQYGYGTQGGIAMAVSRASSCQQSGMDNYCWYNTGDLNELTSDFYWRQDNYQILIDNGANQINKYGASKYMQDWALDGHNMVKNDGRNGYYYTSACNYYRTDAHIYWSGTNNATVTLWNDVDGGGTFIKDTGRDDGSLVILLFTTINVEVAFTQGLGNVNGRLTEGHITFHDQYGNLGEFYLNYDFPKTYYPVSSDTNPRSITPVPSSKANYGTNGMSYFYNIVIASPSTPPSGLNQDYGYWYHPDFSLWVYLDAGSVKQNSDGWDYTTAYATSACDGNGSYQWIIGDCTGGRPSRNWPAPGTLSLIGYVNGAAYSAICNWDGVTEVDGGHLTINATKASDFIYKANFGPIWTENAFHIFSLDKHKYIAPTALSIPSKAKRYIIFIPIENGGEADWNWRFTQGPTPY